MHMPHNSSSPTHDLELAAVAFALKIGTFMKYHARCTLIIRVKNISLLKICFI